MKAMQHDTNTIGIPSWIMRSSDFLNKLTVSDRSDLLTIAELHYFAKSESIFQAGADSEYVYILKTGQVKIYELSSQAKEVILWFCFPGEIFGLSETTREAKRSVYAHACAPCEIYLIQRVAFNNFLIQHPDAAMSTIELLSCRLRGLSDMISNLTSDDVTSRVIKLLIRMSMLYGEQEQNVLSLNIQLTHQEIADMIGSSRQTVSSTINQLKRDGLIFINNDNIHIDRSSLPDAFKAL